MTPPFQWPLLLRPIFTHLCEAPLPKATSKELRETLNIPHTQNLLQCGIHCGGVGLGTEYTDRLFKQMWIKHKICTFHVYSILQKPKAEDSDCCRFETPQCPKNFGCQFAVASCEKNQAAR